MKDKKELIKMVLIVALIVTIIGVVVFLFHSTEDAYEEIENEPTATNDIQQENGRMLFNDDRTNSELMISDEDEGLIVIREDMFMTQVNEVIRNINRHVGRQITLEGFVLVATHGDDVIYGVGRRAPRLLWR